MDQVAVVDFAVEAPAVDVGGVYFDPVGAAVLGAFFGEAAGARRGRKINKGVAMAVGEGACQAAAGVFV